MLRSLLEYVGSEGVYLGAGLRKYREPLRKPAEEEGGEEEVTEKPKIFTKNTVTFGLPLLRIV